MRRGHAPAAVREAGRARDRASRASTACTSRSGRRTRARVSVVGDFNDWDGRRHPMRKRVDSRRVGDLHPRASARARSTSTRSSAPDGDAAAAEGRPVRLRQPSCGPRPPRWSRDRRRSPGPTTRYLRGRAASRTGGARRSSIYEVHLGSWRAARRRRLPELRRARRAAGPLRRRHGLHPSRAAADLRASVRSILGLPADRPLRADRALRRSRAASRASSTRAHAAGLGVILDWVPAHFPTDAHGLARFDGTALYEHADPRQGFHPDWNTAIYNFGRQRGRRLPASPTRSTGSRSSTSTGCASMRWPRCSTSTIRARPASGCPTSTAATRTSRPSRSCSGVNDAGLSRCIPAR